MIKMQNTSQIKKRRVKFKLMLHSEAGARMRKEQVKLTKQHENCT